MCARINFNLKYEIVAEPSSSLGGVREFAAEPSSKPDGAQCYPQSMDNLFSTQYKLPRWGLIYEYYATYCAVVEVSFVTTEVT